MSTSDKRQGRFEHRERLNPLDQLIGTLLVMLILLLAIILRSL